MTLKSRVANRTRAARAGLGRVFLAVAIFAPSRAIAAAAQSGADAAAKPNPMGPHAAATAASGGSDAAAAVVAGVNQFVHAIFEVIYLITGSIWDIALWVADRMIAFLGKVIVNPFSGDRLLFGGVPGSSQWAAPVLALTLLTVVGIMLAGPLYISWKMWRSRHQNRLHYR